MGQSSLLPPRRAILEIQSGDAGASAWRTLATLADTSLVRVGALDSSESDVTRYVGRDERSGKLKVIGSARTGEVITYTSEIELQDVVQQAIFAAMDGKKSIRVREFTGEYSNPTNYVRIRLMTNAWSTKPFGAFGSDLVNSFTGLEAQADPQRRVFPQNIDEFHEIFVGAFQDISGTVSQQALKDIVSVGYPRHAGEIDGENTNNPGNKEYLAIGVDDGSNLSHVLYTSTKGASWVDVELTGLTNFEGSGICKAGRYVVVSGTDAVGGGLAYAEFDAVKVDAATWTRSSGIAAGTVINAVRAIDANTVIAVGQSGAVYISTDGGVSFASAGTAVTANHLTKIVVAGPDLQWFGGASGTLVRRYKEVMSTVAVTGISTDAVTSLGVPYRLDRRSEIYVGSAGGDLYRSVNGAATTPTWATLISGTGAIDGIAFAEDNSDYMYILQTNGSTQSRLLRDHSRGNCGSDLEAVSGYTSPSNATFNALAVPDANTVMVVGDVDSTYAFIGLLS